MIGLTACIKYNHTNSVKLLDKFYEESKNDKIT